MDGTSLQQLEVSPGGILSYKEALAMNSSLSAGVEGALQKRFF